MKRRFHSLLLGLAVLASTPSHAAHNMGMMVIFDISSSMWGGPLQKTFSALETAMTTIPDKTYTGLIAMGGCGAERVYEAAPLKFNQNEFIVETAKEYMLNVRKYQRLSGGENIYIALQKAKAQLSQQSKIQCLKILILSDYAFTCSKGNQWESLVNDIVSQNEKCNQVDVISINTPAWDADLFDKLTDIGNGEYSPTYDEDDFEEKIKERLKSYQDEFNQHHGDPNQKNNGNRCRGDNC